MKKKIGLYALAIFVVVLLADTIIIGMPRKGVVVDSISGESIAGIEIQRRVNIIIPGLEGSIQRMVKEDTITTDENGRFYSGPFIRIKAPFITGRNELLYVNSSLDKGYFSDHLGREKNHRYAEKPIKFNNTIHLDPMVASLGECKNDNSCITSNTQFAKNCLGHDYFMYGKDEEYKECKQFSLDGTKIFKNKNYFGHDIIDDIKICEKGNYYEGVKSYDRQMWDVQFCAPNIGKIIKPSNCDLFQKELPRNLCYFHAAMNATSSIPAKNLCEKVSDTKFKWTEEYSANKDQIDDYHEMCLRQLQDKGWGN